MYTLYHFYMITNVSYGKNDDIVHVKMLWSAFKCCEKFFSCYFLCPFYYIYL